VTYRCVESYVIPIYLSPDLPFSVPVLRIILEANTEQHSPVLILPTVNVGSSCTKQHVLARDRHIGATNDLGVASRVPHLNAVGRFAPRVVAIVFVRKRADMESQIGIIREILRPHTLGGFGAVGIVEPKLL